MWSSATRSPSGGRDEHDCEPEAEGPDGTGIEKMTMARYHEVTRVNQDGAVRMSLAFVPLLKKAGDGQKQIGRSS